MRRPDARCLAVTVFAVTLLSPACSTPSQAPAAVRADAAPAAAPPEGTMIRFFDFSTPAGVAPFRSVDDRVMGGISRSRIVPTEDRTAVFTGDLSLEQNGGFASVRASDLALDLAAYSGVILRVRGDGQRYKLRLTDSAAFDTPSHQASFEAGAGAWREVRLPFSGFVATWRGRALPDAPPLDLSSVRRVGLMISDEQAGPFRLEIAWIGAYRD